MFLVTPRQQQNFGFNLIEFQTQICSSAGWRSKGMMIKKSKLLPWKLRSKCTVISMTGSPRDTIYSQTVDQFWKAEKVKGSIIHLHVSRYIYFFRYYENGVWVWEGGMWVWSICLSFLTGDSSVRRWWMFLMRLTSPSAQPFLVMLSDFKQASWRVRTPELSWDVIAGILLPSCGWFWTTRRAETLTSWHGQEESQECYSSSRSWQKHRCFIMPHICSRRTIP